MAFGYKKSGPYLKNAGRLRQQRTGQVVELGRVVLGQESQRFRPCTPRHGTPARQRQYQHAEVMHILLLELGYLPLRGTRQKQRRPTMERISDIAAVCSSFLPQHIACVGMENLGNSYC